MVNKYLWSLVLVFLLGCGGAACPQAEPPQLTTPIPSNDPVEQPDSQATVDPVQQERDTIYSLLAYAVVLKNWQTENTTPARGHNIGSVLVNPGGEVVSWARNCNKITGNGTQHGEVRLMRDYLAKVETYNLKNYVVYTTLEPCAMCSGMMVLQSIGRTVYGQTDPDYGKAIERLKLDSSSLQDGYKPYPRTENLTSQAADNDFRRELDEKYKAYKDGGGKGLTKWLLSDDAKRVYEAALTAFNEFDVQHRENAELYQAAKAFYETVPDTYVAD